MSLVNRALNAYRSRRLGVELALGTKQLGRPPGAVALVNVPVRASIAMRVLRADGTVEEHGVIGTETGDVPAAYLDELRQQAGG